MNKPTVAKFIKSTQMLLSKHSPEILMGIGIAGMITTTVLAVKATPKALVLIQDAEISKTDKQVKAGKAPNEIDSKLTPIETIKTTWKCYIPAVVTGVASTACLIGASTVHTKRNAALATAYKLSETALTEYREKVVETIGEKKEQLVREAVAKDKVEKTPVSKSEVIITERGNTLCYDIHSGRYFRSDIDRIKKAVNEINRKMTYDMYVSLNEFYDELNLEHTKMGDLLGWNLDDGLLEVDYSSHMADDGTPCIAMNYSIAPKYGYSSFM